MDFFKAKVLQKLNKTKQESESEEETRQRSSEQTKDGYFVDMDPSQTTPTAAADAGQANEEECEEDDDDFIASEVKRRLKELRNKSFMGLIPEESCHEEDDDETSSSEWRESDDTAAGDGVQWCGFDTLYRKYCERMLFFDKLMVQQLKDAELWSISNHSPKSTPKKLALAIRNLSFKRRDENEDDCEHLQRSPDDNPYHILETAYVAQVCLSWEVLHLQYLRLCQNISSHPEDPASYCYAAQAFQQFQVLLQRFIENEPFEQGTRVETYARSRISLPNLLQIPNLQGLDEKKHEGDDTSEPIYAVDLMKIIQESILTFRLLLKADKKKSASSLHLFKSSSQAGGSFQQVQASLDKKEAKLKDLGKKKGWKKKGWPSTLEEAEQLLALIDIKVIARVLRMVKISKEELLWCEEKMGKLDLSGNKLQRDGSPILFPSC